MSDQRNDSVVLGFPDYSVQARRFAAAAGLPYAEIAIHAFPDGESLVQLPANIAEHVVLCRTLTDANNRLIELELAMATARKQGARRLTLVAPYLCYMRQDKAFHLGEAVSQRIIGELLARRLDAIVTVDPHLHRVSRLEDAVPIRRTLATTATGLMADWVKGRGGDPLILGPDDESAQWVSQIASAGDRDYFVADKERRGDRDVRIALPEADFDGRDVVLADDVASTGHTLAEASRQVLERGAASVVVLVTHALFAEGALANLQSAGVAEIVSTDSIPHPSNRLHIDQLLASALREVWSPAAESG